MAQMRGTLPGSVRVVQVPLEGALTPTELLRTAGGDLRPFALTGRWAGGGALVSSDPLVVLEEGDDPFGALDRQPALVGDVGPAAVGGGWVGYLGYQLAAELERLPCGAAPGELAAPRAALSFYDHLVHFDRAEGRWFFEALWSAEQSARLSSRLDTWRRRLAGSSAPRGEYRFGAFSPLPRPQAHLVAVARAIEHIRAGDTYQVNVCLGFRAEFRGDPLQAWCDGAQALAPAYGAYLGYSGLTVASFSPELFLRSQGGEVRTSPIKGTSPAADGSVGLATSAKDRAENVMIVDLMRNDLGRVCRTGTVAVPELCRTESHPGVWHLVSDVTGTLAEGVHHSDLVRATFPPGSVTGAPKVAAMVLIAELEAVGRGVYTGCIGIASPVSGLELSVAIRTFELSGAAAWLGVGGGVVAESDPLAELSECVTKAAPLVAAVGSLLEMGPFEVPLDRPTEPDRAAEPGWAGVAHRSGLTAPRSEWAPDPELGIFETILVYRGRAVAAEAHIARLATSVAMLYSARLPAVVGGDVAELASRCEGPHRLRMLARPATGPAASPGCNLDVFLSVEPAPAAFAGRPGPPATLIPMEMSGGLGEHKWLDRRVLAGLGQGFAEQFEGAAERFEGAAQILLVDREGSVLEAERANVFAVFGDVLSTPPADGRILAGTTRDAVLRCAGIAGMRTSHLPLSLAALRTADEVFLTSSVAGVLPVAALEGIRWMTPGPTTSELAALVWQRWQRSARIKSSSPTC